MESLFLSKPILTRLEEEGYPTVIKKLIEMGVTNVYDIGCGDDDHIEEFKNKGFNYIGIDEVPPVDYPDFNFIYGTYPIKLHPEKDAVAISVCCIGARNLMRELDAMVEGVKEEFSHFICHTFTESHYLIAPKWKNKEVLYHWSSPDGFVSVMTVHYWN